MISSVTGDMKIDVSSELSERAYSIKPPIYAVTRQIPIPATRNRMLRLAFPFVNKVVMMSGTAIHIRIFSA